MAVQSYGHGARTPPAAGRWTFEQLFVNGRRVTHAHAERVLSANLTSIHSVSS